MAFPHFKPDLDCAPDGTGLVVGVVDVPGTISAGDEVTVEIYVTPSWLERSGD